MLLIGRLSYNFQFDKCIYVVRYETDRTSNYKLWCTQLASISRRCTVMCSKFKLKLLT